LQRGFFVAKKAADKASSDGGSVASYFKEIFKENPSLLTTRSNDEILLRWLKDHPGEKTVPARIKGNLSNVKSVLRKKRRKKPGRKPGQPAVSVIATVVAEPARISTKGFEKLEEQIDDCLTAARNLDREVLHNVIGLLRKARNEVVWKLGQ
jgi:hypothetical protein